MADDKDMNIKDIVVKLKQNAKGEWLGEVRVQTNDLDNLQQMLTDAMDNVTAEKVRRNPHEGY